MFTLELYVGEGFRAHSFVRILILSGIVGGATITQTSGFWKAPDGELFDEPGHAILFAVESDKDVHQLVKLARHQAAVWHEQSIMVRLPTLTYFAEASLL